MYICIYYTYRWQSREGATTITTATAAAATAGAAAVISLLF